WFPPLFAAICGVLLASASAWTGPQRSGTSTPKNVPPYAAMNAALAKGFGNRPGAGLVMDVTGGGLLSGRDLPLAVRRLVLPGSTIKPFVLYALLESGTLRPDDAFVCPVKLEIDGVRLDCPHPEI